VQAAHDHPSALIISQRQGYGIVSSHVIKGIVPYQSDVSDSTGALCEQAFVLEAQPLDLLCVLMNAVYMP